MGGGAVFSRSSLSLDAGNVSPIRGFFGIDHGQRNGQVDKGQQKTAAKRLHMGLDTDHHRGGKDP
jgi:hypothetical protein